MPLPLVQSDNSQLRSLTAGNIRWEIDTGYATGGPVSFVEIRGHKGNTPDFEQVTEDDTDAGSNGWTSKYPTGNGWGASLEGLTKTSGTYPNRVLDPGTAVLLKAGRTIGDPAIVHVRWAHTDELGYALESQAFEGYATCKSNTPDGKPPKLLEWKATFEGRGKPISIAAWFAAAMQAATATLNGATSFYLVFNGIPTAALANTSTAANVQTAIQAIAGMSAVTATGTTGGPYAIGNIPPGTRLAIASNNGLATFA